MPKLHCFRSIRNYKFVTSDTTFKGNYDHSSSSHLISDIPPQGIIISTPGTYVFTNDIYWTPTAPLAVGITVTVSNVCIDLNNHKFNCFAVNLLSVGILSLNSNSLSVKNGEIKYMGLIGVASIGGKDIRYSNVKIIGLTLNNPAFPGLGIIAVTCENVRFYDIAIADISITGLALAGILLDEVKDSRFIKCDFSNLKNEAGLCAGITYIMCNGSSIKHIKINNLATGSTDNLLAPGHTAIGIVPFQSENLKINKCWIKDIIGGCDDSHGISLFVVKNAVVKNCYVENVIDGLSGVGAKATGIEVYTFTDIQDTTLTRETVRPPGNILIKNCHVRNIIAINPGDKQAAGFSVAGSSVKFEDCTAENVAVFDENKKQNMDSFGVGYGWAPDIRDMFIYPAYKVEYINCKAINCQVGFDTFYHINSTWNNIVSCNNGINIMLLKCNSRILFCNQCSECPDVPIGQFKYVTIDNIARCNEINNIETKYDAKSGCNIDHLGSITINNCRCQK